MMAPCSVNASMGWRRPPRPPALFEVANCDLKAADSSAVSWKQKSSGKRPALRLTCSFSRFVGTP
jgi:hypothetical protein